MKTMILAGGGLRSLVASALALAEPRKQVVWLLHVKRPGTDSPQRTAMARKQAGHYQTCRLVEIDEPGVNAAVAGSAASGSPAGSPAAPAPAFESFLETVVEYAADAGVGRLIWPVQFDGAFSRLAAVTERVMLLRHRLASRGITVPRIETPLAELTDPQLLELGAVMRVPWELAWSCAGVGTEPCGECAGCRRRAAAFAALLLDDPLLPQTPGRRLPAR